MVDAGKVKRLSTITAINNVLSLGPVRASPPLLELACESNCSSVFSQDIMAALVGKALALSRFLLIFTSFMVLPHSF